MPATPSNPPTAPKPAAAPTGRSIIAGKTPDPGRSPLLPSDAKFYALDPHSGTQLPTLYLAASNEELDAACWQAWQAFHWMQERPATDRARLLELIAQKILDLGEDLLGLATDETGLGPARLVSERERTVGQLRMFANLVRKGDWVQASIDTGQPSRRPLPKPDLRRLLRPLGPVAVFGASNFPLAYSTAGGDTASALAAGCPVVVKGHPSHPGTGELVGQAITQAVADAGFDPGTFSFLHAGGGRELAIGQQLVRHPAIRAVGFTGSFSGGMALARIGAERADPIPVFAEMGSTNPVFLLPHALETLLSDLAERLYASVTASNGQMCTCPGLIFAPKGDGCEAMLRILSKSMNEAQPQTMLNPRVRHTFAKRAGDVAAVNGVEFRGGSPLAAHRSAEGAEEHRAGEPIRCSPALLRCTFETFRKNPTLHEEVFGPLAIVVVCEGEQQLVDAAAMIQGTLTGTIWAGQNDSDLARRIQTILEQRVGRLIYNGVPTGVEVCPSMVHGGPYPATNQPQSTAVGSFAITRWTRPICYQNTPESMLPPELRNANPLQIRRLVNGEWTDDTGVKKAEG
jgi:alpha-ketoglutaric semialdehyde dehydrogenase